MTLTINKCTKFSLVNESFATRVPTESLERYKKKHFSSLYQQSSNQVISCQHLPRKWKFLEGENSPPVSSINCQGEKDY